jgi:hypothetical protein
MKTQNFLFDGLDNEQEAWHDECAAIDRFERFARPDFDTRDREGREGERCERCGDMKPVGQSCDCFDNGCQ